MQAVDCGKGIFVTGAGGCNEHAAAFARRIHIWGGPGRAGDAGCRYLNEGVPPGDVALQYVDGESLAAAVSLDAIADYARRPGPILIHCAAGQCRGPTVGLMAMVARGEVPWHAMHGITAALWLTRRVTPHWCYIPLAEIFSWWEQNRW